MQLPDALQVIYQDIDLLENILFLWLYIDLLEDNDGIIIILILHICDAEDLMSISCNLAVG